MNIVNCHVGANTQAAAQVSRGLMTNVQPVESNSVDLIFIKQQGLPWLTTLEITFANGKKSITIKNCRLMQIDRFSKENNNRTIWRVGPRSD